jgi:SAM-dependent methyltransferase
MMFQTDYRAQTMRAYDRLAAKLSPEFDLFFGRHAHTEAAFFLSGIDRSGRILDLGCGGGPASTYFVAQGYATISADLSDGMLRQCQRRGLTALVRLDLEAPPFGPRSFDGLWAHTSLLHVPKARLTGALASLGKTLKPQGRFFVALRQGEGEGYKGQPGLERWVSSFVGDEFEEYVPGGLDIVRRIQTQLKNTTFLSYHLVKRMENW